MRLGPSRCLKALIVSLRVRNSSGGNSPLCGGRFDSVAAWKCLERGRH